MTTGGSNAQQLDPAGAGTGEHSDAPVRWLAANGDAADFIELHFTDVAGTLKSVVLPRSQLEETVAYGHWVDGWALEGGARLLETDLLLRPDLRTWGLLPWVEATGERTGRFICDVATPAGEPYPAGPRARSTRAGISTSRFPRPSAPPRRWSPRSRRSACRSMPAITRLARGSTRSICPSCRPWRRPMPW